MIYIFNALYCEAEPLIREYGLKKKTDETCFPVFFSEKENILLAVTGCGMNAATAAVARICTKRTPQPEDFLVNIGTCAWVSTKNESDETYKNVSGEVYLCKKITEDVTGRTFYPDILYRHPFVEQEIVTGAMPYRTEYTTELISKHETVIKNSAAGGFLYDMEASSIYQAGAYFFGPHQMSFLKIVTDWGNVLGLSAEILKQSVADTVPEIRSYLDELMKIDEIKKLQNGKKLEKVSVYAQRIGADMHCSAVMRASVIQQLKYAVLAGIDYQGIIEEMYQAGKLPCKDKREGKSCFEELGRKLL